MQSAAVDLTFKRLSLKAAKTCKYELLLSNSLLNVINGSFKQNSRSKSTAEYFLISVDLGFSSC